MLLLSVSVRLFLCFCLIKFIINYTGFQAGFQVLPVAVRSKSVRTFLMILTLNVGFKGGSDGVSYCLLAGCQYENRSIPTTYVKTNFLLLLEKTVQLTLCITHRDSRNGFLAMTKPPVIFIHERRRLLSSLFV